ncbi:hypothetical protein MAR_022450, partial [Mya arenaria]
ERPTVHNLKLYIEKNTYKTLFRNSFRQTITKRDIERKKKILESRKYDSKYFHKLVNSQRQIGYILNGFNTHFKQLAKESRNEMFDEECQTSIHVRNEIKHIKALVTNVEPFEKWTYFAHVQKQRSIQWCNQLHGHNCSTNHLKTNPKNAKRGFTKYASPIKSALMVEQFYREGKDHDSN